MFSNLTKYFCVIKLTNKDGELVINHDIFFKLRAFSTLIRIQREPSYQNQFIGIDVQVFLFRDLIAPNNGFLLSAWTASIK